MKLGLGTAQFGLDYGISNKTGKTEPEEVCAILEVAHQQGIRLLDTAASYGISEEIIGQSLRSHHQFKIVTKTPSFPSTLITSQEAKQLEHAFGRSLSRMKQTSLYGLLIHQADDLLKHNGALLMETMFRLKQRGLVEKIGVSVYTSGQIDRILEQYAIDLIQLPVNVLDQRLLQSGHLSKLKQAGIEIHARSVFLQGLLLMDTGTLPDYFHHAKTHLEHFRQFAQKMGISPKQAALQFAMGIKEIDVVLCGVNNRFQLNECLNCARQPMRPINMERFALSDDSILNPSKWTI